MSDAFFAALQIPNLFRRLLAEGALNSAFVPAWLRVRERDGPRGARRFGERVLGATFALLGAMVLALVVFAPTFVTVLAPGFDRGGARFDAASQFLRLAAPYVAIAGLVAVAAAILNASGRVAAAAYGIVVFNAVMLAAAAWVLWSGAAAFAGTVLVLAVVAAGLAQLALVGAAALRMPQCPRRMTLGRSRDVRALFAKALPGVVAGGMAQLTLMGGLMVASSQPAAVSWLYYSYRLYELPLGIAATSIAAAIVPAIVVGVRGGDHAVIAGVQARGVEMALALALPAALGLALLAHPIAASLFERAAFGPSDSTAVAAALVAMAAGLPGHVLEKALGAIAFAREDTRTPMLAGLAGLAAALAAALYLFPRHGHVGVAAAIAVSGWVGATLLGIVLARRRWLLLARDCARPSAGSKRHWRGSRLAAPRAWRAPVCWRSKSAPDWRFMARRCTRLASRGWAIFPPCCADDDPRALRRAVPSWHVAAAMRRGVGAMAFKQLVFSGVQPSGNLHLGNYLGAIVKFVALQARHDCIYCVVDLHAITVWQDPAELARATREVAAAFIACGIDAKKHIVFNQSQVAEHAELAWIFNCIARLGWLNRMTQFKEKAGKDRENASVGLYAYPTLMAADILAYRATHVPVGEDQKQHLELARDVAQKFNNDYAASIAARTGEAAFFPLPEPLIQGPATRVMSLRDGAKKMSKSDPSDYSRINLTDDADAIAQKIRKAKTDPEPLPSEEKGLETRPEADNLVGIFAALAERTRADVLRDFGGAQFSAFKAALVDLAVARLAPIGAQMQRLARDAAYIDAVLADGARRARIIAADTMASVKDIVGLVRS
ncbi:MAG: tryptophan--tRNA ligase [Proteobacteria bacterium]|nr:tryptophan--tRNA ligase [Pseudomonadota bacterium]